MKKQFQLNDLECDFYEYGSLFSTMTHLDCVEFFYKKTDILMFKVIKIECSHVVVGVIDFDQNLGVKYFLDYNSSLSDFVPMYEFLRSEVLFCLTDNKFNLHG